MDLSEESKEAQQEHARLLKQVEAERRARTMVVPTKTEDVARKLRYDAPRLVVACSHRCM